jgi:hypothetical protein
MTTPTREQIVERATALFMMEQGRHYGLGESLPEVCELKEAGYLDKAKMELMSEDLEVNEPEVVPFRNFNLRKLEAKRRAEKLSGYRYELVEDYGFMLVPVREV